MHGFQVTDTTGQQVEYARLGKILPVGNFTMLAYSQYV